MWEAKVQREGRVKTQPPGNAQREEEAKKVQQRYKEALLDGKYNQHKISLYNVQTLSYMHEKKVKL